MSDMRIPMSNLLELERTRLHIDKCRVAIPDMLVDGSASGFSPAGLEDDAQKAAFRTTFRYQLDMLSLLDKDAVRECQKAIREDDFSTARILKRR